MPETILFKYTSRSRVDNFFRGMDSIVNNLANKEDYFVLCSFDIDDADYANPEFRNRVEAYKNTKAYYGTSTSKVNAINRDLPLAPEWDIVVCMSDDQVFLIPGFDDIIRKDMEAFGKGLDCFLHYLDGTPAKEILCTMSILGRTYFNRFGWIYDPRFLSVFCDNIATEIAHKLDCYKFVNLQLYSHLHPAWGTAEKDYLYARNEDKELYRIDHETYLAIKNNNYDL